MRSVGAAFYNGPMTNFAAPRFALAWQGSCLRPVPPGCIDQRRLGMVKRPG